MGSSLFYRNRGRSWTLDPSAQQRVGKSIQQGEIVPGWRGRRGRPCRELSRATPVWERERFAPKGLGGLQRGFWVCNGAWGFAIGLGDLQQGLGVCKGGSRVCMWGLRVCKQDRKDLQKGLEDL